MAEEKEKSEVTDATSVEISQDILPVPVGGVEFESQGSNNLTLIKYLKRKLITLQNKFVWQKFKSQFFYNLTRVKA